MTKIVTSHIFPPIPDRQFDWCAYHDGEEESGHYGYGHTEAEAVADLERLDQERSEANGDEQPADCTCHYGLTPINSATIDPPDYVCLRRDPYCSVHGKDPDEEYERRRDEDSR